MYCPRIMHISVLIFHWSSGSILSIVFSLAWLGELRFISSRASRAEDQALDRGAAGECGECSPGSRLLRQPAHRNVRSSSLFLFLSLSGRREQDVSHRSATRAAAARPTRRRRAHSRRAGLPVRRPAPPLRLRASGIAQRRDVCSCESELIRMTYEYTIYAHISRVECSRVRNSNGTRCSPARALCAC